MKKKILIFVVAALLLSGASVAKAIVFLQRPEAELQPNPNIQKLDPEVLKAWQEARCEKIKTKLDEKMEAIKENHDKHINALNNLKSRLETLILRLENKGYDIDQLETDLATFKVKIDKLNADHKSLLAKIDEVKGKDCSSDLSPKAKTYTGEIRDLIDIIKKDVKDIKNFYKNEIRSDLKAIKSQTPNPAN